MPARQILTATIANAASLSDAIHLAGGRLVGLQMPAAWTAAGITLQASFDGTTYADVYTSTGTEFSITTDASRFVLLDPTTLIGAQRIKLRSGTAGTPVNQLAERLIRVIVEDK